MNNERETGGEAGYLISFSVNANSGSYAVRWVKYDTDALWSSVNIGTCFCELGVREEYGYKFKSYIGSVHFRNIILRSEFKFYINKYSTELYYITL